MESVSEAVAALPPEIRRHFGLKVVPGAGALVGVLDVGDGGYINGTELSVGGGQSA
jgi:hypothetical protein